jgi:uncharacterized protein YbjQ (UPF0145 family)
MAQTPLGTEFTYQGELNDSSGNPLTGQYDFKFVAYDASNDGTGTNLATITIEDVQVTDGIFTTSLDLGSGTFIGDKIWLEINVRTGTSTGSFTQLLPRQQVTATPYATHAQFVGADAVTDIEIQDGSITAADLGTDSVTANEIAANAVGTSEIDSTQVQRRVFNSCGVGEYMFAIDLDGSVNCATDIGLTSVTGFQIVDLSIQSVDLADGSVTSAKIADGTIQSIDLANSSILIGKLGANSVDSSKVVDNSIVASDLATNSVGTSEIVASQVQRRVSTTCDFGDYLIGINEDGSVICNTLPISLNKVLGVGNFVQIVQRTSGMPIILYNDSGYRIFDCSNIKCSQGVASSVLFSTGGGVSMAIRQDGRPIISFLSSGLNVYSCDDTTCSTGTTHMVDNTSGLSHTSIASRTIGNPFIAYTSESQVFVLNCNNANCVTGTKSSIANYGLNISYFNSISAVVRSNNNPYITFSYSYNDSFEYNLLIANCQDFVCATPGVSTVGINNSLAYFPRLSLRNNAIPYISYVENTGIDIELFIFICDNTNCSSSSTINTNIKTTNVYGINAANIDFTNPLIYYKKSGSIFLYKCSLFNCTSGVEHEVILESTTGFGLVKSLTGNPIFAYSSFDGVSTELKTHACLDAGCIK